MTAQLHSLALARLRRQSLPPEVREAVEAAMGLERELNKIDSENWRRRVDDVLVALRKLLEQQ